MDNPITENQTPSDRVSVLPLPPEMKAGNLDPATGSGLEIPPAVFDACPDTVLGVPLNAADKRTLLGGERPVLLTLKGEKDNEIHGVWVEQNELVLVKYLIDPDGNILNEVKTYIKPEEVTYQGGKSQQSESLFRSGVVEKDQPLQTTSSPTRPGKPTALTDSAGTTPTIVQPVEPPVVIPLEKIPDKLYGVELKADYRTQLSQGQWSGLLRNAQLPDGSIRDVKVRLSEGQNGQLRVQHECKAEKLELPKYVLNRKLTAEEQLDLLNKKAVGPIHFKGADFFLVVDQELNKVIVKTDRELGVPDPEKIGQYKLEGMSEMGGYVFSATEKHQLANGEKLPAKVYQAPDGSFFAAELRVTEDRKGVEFSNVKALSKTEALELKEKLNVPPLLPAAAAAETLAKSLETVKKQAKGITR